MATAPTVNTVQYSTADTNGGADSLFLWWNTNGGTSFTARITNVAAGTDTDFTGLAGPFATLSPGLTAGTGYTVTMIAVQGDNAGLSSASIPIITTMPAMTRLANNTTSLDVAWTDCGDCTYAVTVQLGDTSQTQTTTQTALTYAVTQPITGTSNSVGVQIIDTGTNDGVTHHQHRPVQFL